MSTYEVRLYNARVREALEQGEPNRTGLSDRWADAIYETVSASDAQMAAKMIRVKFPPHNGFVITNILLVTEEGVVEVPKREYMEDKPPPKK